MEYNFDDLQVEAIDFNTIRLSYGGRGMEIYDIIHNRDMHANRHWNHNTLIINCRATNNLTILKVTVNGENTQIRTATHNVLEWCCINQLYVELCKTYVLSQWSIDVHVGSEFAQQFKPLPSLYDDGWLQVHFESMQTDANYKIPCHTLYWHYHLHDYMMSKSYIGILISNQQIKHHMDKNTPYLIVDFKKCDCNINVYEHTVVIRFIQPFPIKKYFSICI
jgi:hypothetical protein